MYYLFLRHIDSPMDPLYIPDSNNSDGSVLKVSISSDNNTLVKDYPEAQDVAARISGRKKPKRTLECSVCSKRFNFKHHLRRHMSTHTNHCKQCDQSFSLKKDLKLHENTAHGRPIHSCSMCSFVSEYRKNFMRHLMEIHSNEQFITCRDCDYIGGTRIGWEAHMKRMHKKKFFCYLCCTAFSRKVNARSHVLWKHPGNNK
ncbi:PREDICTED: zinc finger protein 567-like [Dinoponera quadriceps]|uniref:Zinc finger protein 567-like n=1 Tax=Dinoponera quadriceps TaxID=609295 RepID=A0A6P3X0C5_DINQU|nr:PREDICTED: zinc finger protein 567-like [Dinoponera quadriceps]